jgi:hypothetical protein
MANIVILIGPQAVGKMTVGQELAKLTDYRLFHNHMTIDLVNNFFDYSTPEGKKLVASFRQEIFEESSKSPDVSLIFTFVWAFDQLRDWEFIENLHQIYTQHGNSVYFVELEADLKERLRRNKHEHRLSHKPSKRNLEWSEGELLRSIDKYRLVSNPGEIPYPNYLRINNTNLEADQVAKTIQKHFLLN